MRKPPVNPFTFGKNKADTTVAKLLSQMDNKNTTALVSRILHRISVITKELAKMTNYKHYLYDIIRKETFKQIDTFVKDKDLKSYLRNTVTGKLRRGIK